MGRKRPGGKSRDTVKIFDFGKLAGGKSIINTFHYTASDVFQPPTFITFPPPAEIGRDFQFVTADGQ